jgi:uncharacterized membrane-anchored protein
MKKIEYLALALIAIGILGLIGWAASAFFLDPQIHFGIRTIAGISTVGFVLLMGYVVTHRVRKARKEPKNIKEVKH